jgi:hypothetical protein
MIRKLKSGNFRLYSRKVNPQTGRRRMLGTFASREMLLRSKRYKDLGAPTKTSRIADASGETGAKVQSETASRKIKKAKSAKEKAKGTVLRFPKRTKTVAAKRTRKPARGRKAA